MNLDQVNKWLTLVANIGVVVGIVFVGYQIRMNTNSMRSNTQAQMVTNWISILQDVATNPDLVRAWMMANEVGLNAVERDPVAMAQAGYLASGMLRSTEYEFTEFRRGNVDEEVWSAHVRASRGFLAGNPFVLISWKILRMTYSETFREFYDNLIIEVCSRQTCPVGGRPEDWATSQAAVVAP